MQFGSLIQDKVVAFKPGVANTQAVEFIFPTTKFFNQAQLSANNRYGCPMKVILYLALMVGSFLSHAQDWRCSEELCADGPALRQSRSDLLIQRYITQNEGIRFYELHETHSGSGTRRSPYGRMDVVYRDTGELIEVRSSLSRNEVFYVSAVVMFVDDPNSDQDVRTVVSSSISLGKYLRNGWSFDLGIVKDLFGIEARASAIGLDPDGMVLVLRRKY